MKKITAAAVIAVFCLASVSALAARGGQGGNPNTGFVEFMLYPGNPPNYPPAPPEYAAAGGKVKYNLSGPNLAYTLKAYGLVPGQEYHIYTCGDIVGVGAADERGEIYVSGSASGPYHDIRPDDFFTIRLPDDRFTIFLITPEHGYDWREPLP